MSTMTTSPPWPTSCRSARATCRIFRCSGGPGLVGVVSSRVQEGLQWAEALFQGGAEAALKAGLFTAIAFPVVMALGALLVAAVKRKGAAS